MRTRVGTLLGCLLLLAACSGEPDPGAADPTTPPPSSSPSATPSATTPTPSETAEPTPTPTSEPPAARGTRIIVDGSPFGPMLYDATGQAIYLFEVETTSKPRCLDACAEAWPPVFTDGEPVAGEGVDPSLLGTTARPGGRRQVTYNDHPLYFYVNEGKYEVLCHDVFLNGGNWYVVQPDGSAAPPG